ncbi:hypothetical protein COEREDRAFT_14181 [Coemansia reversa NRRL 1564]|uniref:ZZ-type domain-containing protein n=1 Tax=Coemansia reversa (strain ATCC 12441 / NRRL 1564) TaxID=763665 RepID=A0A2G5BGQ1_COERN|nr:hypothetical protein COEREDRAFT_14181 [Coemansia reversa NRRL 1564]|eukprot:PIA18171.1 hypothetical protein COEREDRAFT_14181 [Coemansia reversa NRRL 1564]
MAAEESITAAIPPSLDAFPTKAVVAAIPSPTPEPPVTCEASDVVRNNDDYMLVYRAIETLKSQLSRAKSDMDILVKLREHALANPVEYVEALVSGTAQPAPSRQNVLDIPSVDIEPYLSNASSQAVTTYTRVFGRKSGFWPSLAIDDASSTVHRSRPVRLASARGGARELARATRSSTHQPHTANSGRLTGNTAVATPEKSPKFTQRRQQLQHHNASKGVYDQQKSMRGAAAAVHTASADIFLVPPAGTAASTHHGDHVAPPMERANTEPLCTSSGPRAQFSCNGDKKQARHTRADSDTRVSATQPTTPTRSGKSLKMLTPQMLAGFRQPESSPSGDEDDEYYNRLVQSVAEEPTDASARVSGANASVPLQTTESRPAGKSLLFKNISQPSHDAGKVTPVPKPGRGRPRKNASARPRPKVAKLGARGPTRYDDGTPKPPSYNLPWSDHEQTTLERLLIEFPEEEVANDRWRKISMALGTRTMRQVASRVQKYFIKLSKAGLPVPGRVPNTSNWSSLSRPLSAAPTTNSNVDSSADNSVGTLRQQRRGRMAGSGSASGSHKRKHVDFTSSEEEEIDIDFDDYDDQEALNTPNGMPLPYDRKGKQIDRSSGLFASSGGFEVDGFELAAGTSSSMWMDSASASTSTSAAQSSALRSAKAVHLGYRCDSCLAEPIVGIRWNCLDCRGAHTVDLCDECREEGTFETEWHKDTHNFHAKRDAEMEPYYANEVAATALREYSYLA